MSFLVTRKKCSTFFTHQAVNHGTIIRTGITCEKIQCHIRDSTCRRFIVKKAKIF